MSLPLPLREVRFSVLSHNEESPDFRRVENPGITRGNDRTFMCELSQRQFHWQKSSASLCFQNVFAQRVPIFRLHNPANIRSYKKACFFKGLLDSIPVTANGDPLADCQHQDHPSQTQIEHGLPGEARRIAVGHVGVAVGHRIQDTVGGVPHG